ncbi:hypothetical protein PFBG_06228 [Plasmodium falciparum 7G8]|uniref:Uncharacterized protein n=1 Tax=Plasmodium falciparum (isolate 7G8) TaxID=57266 RepID=W7F270_PLAF8|nr:hypothetical protein PFBG_06228 [Plasmodium falciparum 7G8]
MYKNKFANKCKKEENVPTIYKYIQINIKVFFSCEQPTNNNSTYDSFFIRMHKRKKYTQDKNIDENINIVYFFIYTLKMYKKDYIKNVEPYKYLYILHNLLFLIFFSHIHIKKFIKKLFNFKCGITDD